MLEGMKKALSFLRNKLSGKHIPCIALLTAIAMIITTLIGYSIRTYTIFDGERTYKVNSFFAGLENALNTAALKSDKYKVIQANAGRISIAYIFPVYITTGDKTVSVDSLGGTTVGEILESAGYTVDEYDMVEPSLDTVVNDTVYIDYTDINYISETYTEAIPAKTVTVYSNDYKKGVEQLEGGRDGLQQVTLTSKVENGVTVEQKITDVVVLNEAVDAKKIVGTKAAPAVTVINTASSVKTVSTLVPPYEIELDASGTPVNYKNHITVQATAYTYTGKNCATGVAPQPGYIAVNPKVIPYGTKMFIKSSDGRFIYGYAVAADTGGFIKSRPTNVDLFFSSLSECRSFGRRNVEIYILE